MKNSIEKRFSRTILAASIAAIGVATPLTVKADESADDIRNLTTPGSQVEVGVGHVSNSSFKYGDYGRGLEKSGSYLIGNIQMNKRGDNNASYLEIIGRNLGLDGSRDIKIMGGEQGNYGLSFEYDELSKLYSDSFQSPYSGMGSSVLTKPAGWAGTIDRTPGGAVNAPIAATNVTTTMMTALEANMKRFDVETKRKAAAFGLTKQLTGGWNFAVNYKHDQKDGAKLTGAPFQIAGAGTRGVVLVPEPINYATDLFDVAARYADEKKQMQIAYHASLFNNTNRSLVFDNLYYNPLSTVGGSTLTGQLGQMPDNQFHRLSASGGYTFSKDTRLTGKLSLGRMTQDEAFLPYMTSGALVATAPASLYVLPGLPASSLNGKINTLHLDVKLDTKLTQKTALTAGYKYDDRDNRTPVNTYFYLPADNNSATSYPNSATSGYRRRNTPLSNTRQMLYADLDYELSRMTKLKFGYDYNKITRNEMATSGDHEHTLKAEVKHNFNDTTSGRLAYTHSDRNADAYNGSAGLANTYELAYLATLCVAPNTFSYNGVTAACTGAASATGATYPWIDTPAIRKFFLADRKRDKLNAFANFAPGEKLDLQLGASYYVEKYPDTEDGFGLTKATGWSANFDANLAATDKINGTFFTTFEEYSTDVKGHNGGAGTIGTGGTAVTVTNLNRQNNTAAFDVRTGDVTRTDRSLTLGLGFKVKPNSNFDWGGNYIHATTLGLTGFKNLGIGIAPGGIATGTPPQVVLPVPDTVTRLNRLELFGKYKARKDVTLNMKYAFEKYNSTDWAWDGQTPTSSTSLVGTGQTSPSYRVHAIGASLTYNFK